MRGEILEQMQTNSQDEQGVETLAEAAPAKVSPGETFKQFKAERQRARDAAKAQQQQSATNPEKPPAEVLPVETGQDPATEAARAAAGCDLLLTVRKSGPLTDRYEQKLKLLRVPDVYFFPFSKPGLEKPWLDNKEKMDEYFNYGFTEESFKVYAQKVVKYYKEYA